MYITLLPRHSHYNLSLEFALAYLNPWKNQKQSFDFFMVHVKRHKIELIK